MDLQSTPGMNEFLTQFKVKINSKNLYLLHQNVLKVAMYQCINNFVIFRSLKMSEIPL